MSFGLSAISSFMPYSLMVPYAKTAVLYQNLQLNNLLEMYVGVLLPTRELTDSFFGF